MPTATTARPPARLATRLENKYGNDGTNANNGDASIGGPVYIPKLINGRNKFFFFFSGIIDNFAGVGPATATIPTAAGEGRKLQRLFQRITSVLPVSRIYFGGRCSAAAWRAPAHTGTPYFGQYQLYNPYSVVIDANGVPRRTPFCGNMIPANLLANSAMTKFYNSIIPGPQFIQLQAAATTFTPPSPRRPSGTTPRARTGS